MFKYFTLLFLSITIHTGAQAPARFRFVELAYGLFTIGPVTNHGEAPPSASNNLIGINPEYIDKTNRIYAKSGNQFGVQYRLSGAPNDTVKIEVEWVFPEAMIDPIKQKRMTSIRTLIDLPCNVINSSTYSLNNNFEMIKGVWTLNLYYHDKVIYTRQFTLH